MARYNGIWVIMTQMCHILNFSGPSCRHSTLSNFYGSKWLANFGLFQSFPIGHGTEPVYKLALMMATAPGDDAQGQFERLQWPAPAAAGRTSSSSEPLRERQPVRRPVVLHLSNLLLLLLLLLTVELSASWLQ